MTWPPFSQDISAINEVQSVVKHFVRTQRTRIPKKASLKVCVLNIKLFFLFKSCRPARLSERDFTLTFHKLRNVSWRIFMDITTFWIIRYGTFKKHFDADFKYLKMLTDFINAAPYKILNFQGYPNRRLTFQKTGTTT